MSSRYDAFGQGPGLEFVQSPGLERRDFVPTRFYIGFFDSAVDPRPGLVVPAPEEFGWDSNVYFVRETANPEGGGAYTNTQAGIPIAIPPGIWGILLHVKGFCELTDLTLEAKFRNSIMSIGYSAGIVVGPNGLGNPFFPTEPILNSVSPQAPAQTAGVVRVERYIDLTVQNTSGSNHIWFLAGTPASDQQFGTGQNSRPQFRRFGLFNWGRCYKNTGLCKNLPIVEPPSVLHRQELNVTSLQVYPVSGHRPMVIREIKLPATCPPTI